MTRPLSAEEAIAAHAQRGNLRVGAGQLLWLETEPATGNNRLLRYGDDGVQALTPPEVSVRSQVNGYGGGAFCILGECVYFVDGTDQQIQMLNLADDSQRPLTHQTGVRFGALVADPVRGRILAVCEHLDEGYGVGQTLVSVDAATGESMQLAGDYRGRVNLGCATLSADGHGLAWVEWTLPAMPWEQTRLRRAVLDEAGAVSATEECPTPAPAAIQQPLFIGDQLYALSDHAGWWLPYWVDHYGRWIVQSLDQVDYANAPWQLDERHYAWLGDGCWVRVRYDQGWASLVLTDEAGRVTRRLADEYTDFRSLQVMDGKIYVIARRSESLDSVLQIEPDSGIYRVLAGGETTPACQRMPPPEPFDFSARDNQTVHGYLYRPAGEESPSPPVIVRVHGGPTSAAYAVFDPQVAFWTSNGFAVADVNYRGSTGYGRVFRMSLKGQWGQSDWEDICDAVTHLAGQTLVDGRRAFVMGRSAGGFTVLNALIHSDVFLAGASLFGVSDPESLRHMTHRFESGYLDWLLGNPDTHLETWQQRTPLFWADRITCPVIFFQGEQDAVVVPEQTDSMAHVLECGGVPVKVVRFPDEGHGFRRAENQARVLRETLQFFRECLPVA
ncbi:alpha/beta hydrolase family protein [Marinobacter fonticola]|uniref:alpha/beta hydrolase family protein n=1 Tax=Marinobacter fonticola TaxID=2603215 RepID=UPI0011E7B326|nr:prolyl oligopeptidase family serine peptidase [Marinobacter fonticola]